MLCKLKYKSQHSTDSFYPILNQGSIDSYRELRRGDPNYTSSFSTPGNVKKLGNDAFVFFRVYVEGCNGDRTRYGNTNITGDLSLLQDQGWISLHDQLKLTPSPRTKFFTWENTILRKIEAINIRNKTKDTLLKDGIQYYYRTDVFSPNKNTFKKFKSRQGSFTEEIFYGKDIMLGIALSTIYELRQLKECGFQEYFFTLLNKSTEKEQHGHLGNLIKGLFRIEGKYPVSVRFNYDTNEDVLRPRSFGVTGTQEKEKTELFVKNPGGDGSYNRDLSINKDHKELADQKTRMKYITDRLPVLRKLKGKFKNKPEQQTKYSEEEKKLQKEYNELEQKISTASIEQERVIGFFKKHKEEFEIDDETISTIPFPKLAYIEREYGVLLEEREVTFKSLANTSLEKLKYLIESSCYKDILFSKLEAFFELNEYPVERLKQIEKYKLKTAFLKEYMLKTLFELFDKNPRRLECVCSDDLNKLVADCAPEIDPIVMDYIEEFDFDCTGAVDFEEVAESLKEGKKEKFIKNLEDWYSKWDDFEDKITQLCSSFKSLKILLPDAFVGEKPNIDYFKQILHPEICGGFRDNDVASVDVEKETMQKEKYNSIFSQFHHKRRNEANDLNLESSGEPSKKKRKQGDSNANMNKEQTESSYVPLLITLPQMNEFYLEIDVPADGSCLFYSIVFSTLLSALNNQRTFHELYLKLFCEKNAGAETSIKNLLLQYDGSQSFIKRHAANLEVLVDVDFRQRLVVHMREREKEFSEQRYTESGDFAGDMTRMSMAKTFGGLREVEAASQFLQRKVVVYQKLDGSLKEIHVSGKAFSETLHIILAASKANSAVLNHYHFCLLPKYFPVQQLHYPLGTNSELNLQYITETIVDSLESDKPTYAACLPGYMAAKASSAIDQSSFVGNLNSAGVAAAAAAAGVHNHQFLAAGAAVAAAAAPATAAASSSTRFKTNN